MKKTPGDIIIWHMCTKNYDQMMYGSWDMVCDRQMDRQKGGQKKWHVEVGAPPKNCLKKSLKCFTKRIHDVSCVFFAYTMHKYGSHKHSLYFTELKWNRSNTTFLSSGMFFEQNYLFGYIVSSSLKKITHMWRRWGTPQNFFLACIDELEKQIILKKTVEVGQ